MFQGRLDKIQHEMTKKQLEMDLVKMIGKPQDYDNLCEQIKAKTIEIGNVEHTITEGLILLNDLIEGFGKKKKKKYFFNEFFFREENEKFLSFIMSTFPFE